MAHTDAANTSRTDWIAGQWWQKAPYIGGRAVRPMRHDGVIRIPEILQHQENAMPAPAPPGSPSPIGGYSPQRGREQIIIFLIWLAVSAAIISVVVF